MVLVSGSPIVQAFFIPCTLNLFAFCYTSVVRAGLAESLLESYGQQAKPARTGKLVSRNGLIIEKHCSA